MTEGNQHQPAQHSFGESANFRRIRTNLLDIEIFQLTEEQLDALSMPNHSTVTAIACTSLGICFSAIISWLLNAPDEPAVEYGILGTAIAAGVSTAWAGIIAWGRYRSHQKRITEFKDKARQASVAE